MADPSPCQQPTAPVPSREPEPPAGAAKRAVFAAGEIVATRYRVARYIAKGGMGEVYEAYDTALEEPVALKTIRSEIARDGDAVERFKREIQTARRITHPNVCRVFDLGFHRAAPGDPARTGDALFLTMELLPGETLSARIARGPLEPAEALEVVEQVAAALEAAHAAGVVHRDLKSANVMLLSHERKGVRAVVTDFGLSRSLAPDGDAGAGGEPGAIVGTAAYMAPEQVEGKPLTPAADIYALGVVMYEMLTRRRPFEGGPAMDVAARRLSEDPVSPRAHRAAIDPRWEAVILRCLEREPAARFGSAREVVVALHEGDVPAAAETRRPDLAATVVPLALLAALYGLALVAVKQAWFFFASPAEFLRALGAAPLWAPLVLLALPRAGTRALGLFRQGGRLSRRAVLGSLCGVAALAVLAFLAAPRIDLEIVKDDIDADPLDGTALENVVAPAIRGDTLCRSIESRADPGRGCDAALPAEGHLRIRARLGWNRLSSYVVRLQASPSGQAALARVRVDGALRLRGDPERIRGAGGTLEIVAGEGAPPLTGDVEIRLIGRQLPGEMAGEPSLEVSLRREAEEGYVREVATCWSLADDGVGIACRGSSEGRGR